MTINFFYLMTIKRVILALLTLLAIAKIGLSLNDSFSQPQVGGRLELYQTNLVLHVAEFKTNPADELELKDAIDSLIGENPYDAAQKQYQKVRQETVVSRDNFQKQLQQLEAKEAESAARQRLKQQIQSIEQFINELDLKKGIITAVDGNPQAAIAVWSAEIERINNPEDNYAQTASLLRQLWQDQVTQLESSVATINANLSSWFRYQALAKLDLNNNLNQNLSLLQTQEIDIATKAVLKLAFVSGLPIFSCILGVILAIFLIVQRFTKPEKAILATNSNTAWTTPWDWEITWQVLIVGFFFVAQFVLPLLIGLLNINPVNASLRIKALYVLSTYLAMAIGGLTVLYFSIKSFLPLPEDWFKFEVKDRWFLWGLGGYLIALPLVLLVSVINQQIWHGQGGSNPLLLLALQAQDTVALTIFFITSSIAAPVFEEIMFRGFLLPSLTRYISVPSSILISALIFAIAHLSLSEVLPLTTLGIVLAVVYTRSRNLLAPIMLHSLWNSGTLISLFVLGSG